MHTAALSFCISRKWGVSLQVWLRSCFTFCSFPLPKNASLKTSCPIRETRTGDTKYCLNAVFGWMEIRLAATASSTHSSLTGVTCSRKRCEVFSVFSKTRNWGTSFRLGRAEPGKITTASPVRSWVIYPTRSCPRKTLMLRMKTSKYSFGSFFSANWRSGIFACSLILNCWSQTTLISFTKSSTNRIVFALI